MPELKITQFTCHNLFLDPALAEKTVSFGHTVWATFLCYRLAMHLYFFREETDGSNFAVPDQTEVGQISTFYH